jgi:metal iron transporter
LLLYSLTMIRLYQACGILGATVMPHSLYLGSGIVQPRLREYDDQHNLIPARDADDDSLSDDLKYRPSLAAIKHCMNYSIAELAISLFTFALFVNSAILIVSGASLYGQEEATDADLFSIHSLLSKSIAPIAGTLFALALLLSGTSAGIVCTIAGQMVSEGQLNWTMKPWLRRLMTRSISITPSIIIAGAVGQEGLSKALNGSQFALSVILPFVSAPLIWFTCRAQYMKVAVHPDADGSRAEGDSNADGFVQMRNHWITAAFAIVIWGVIVVMNVAALVFAGMGVA